MLPWYSLHCWGSPLPSNDETVYTYPPDILCTVEEVQHMLQRLDTEKANGPDAISARMLNHTASAIAPSVTELFNLSIRTGQLPKDWKVSHVVPIPKRPGAKSPSDFRPISLLSVLSKVLEKHFHMLISDHLASSTIKLSMGLPTKEVCFVHTDQHDPWLVTTTWSREWDWCNILWLRKSFWSSTSPTSNVKTHGPGAGPLWLHNYLANRRRSVVVNGTTSESLHAISGVPEGSILGPLLFLIDITNGPFSPGTQIVLYADDILLYHTISSNSD